MIKIVLQSKTEKEDNFTEFYSRQESNTKKFAATGLDSCTYLRDKQVVRILVKFRNF